ncbi:MAG: 1-(5-phosphoribosyl)-5-[(5-phosphoribosylamino)methylideneamino]imidazole-4-carboxamide isomerase [Deltaproteobacteria bacterium]|nr:1-(5-phosphoribosyl)-5-[(5-phosphoribosylamino)methylideneamino]imidazole-4-carboxamide isomerase [Deltaproteobacteria bacterium]
MIVIPAIDIKDGRCVRLKQGRMDDETVYSDDPVEVAFRWERAGARLIHLVDLDGAVEGLTKNRETIREIIDAVTVEVQIGGGIRERGAVSSYLEEPRVKRVIIGTAAYSDPAFLEDICEEFPERIAVGIDALDGKVAIKGWIETTDEKAIDMARRLEGVGVASIIYTDISRDGMLVGPNIEATAEIAKAVDIPVIASGGVSTIEDIEALKGSGVEGVITGKALYTGSLDLSQAIAAAGESGES